MAKNTNQPRKALTAMLLDLQSPEENHPRMKSKILCCLAVFFQCLVFVATSFAAPGDASSVLVACTNPEFRPARVDARSW